MNTELLRLISQSLQIGDESPAYEIEFTKSDLANSIVEVLCETGVYVDKAMSKQLWQANAGDKFKLLEVDTINGVCKVCTKLEEAVWINREHCNIYRPIIYKFNSMSENQNCELLELEVSASRESACSTATIKFANADYLVPIQDKVNAELVIEPSFQTVIYGESCQYKAYYVADGQKIDITNLCSWNTNGKNQEANYGGVISRNEEYGRSIISATYKDLSATALQCVVHKKYNVACGSIRLKIVNPGITTPVTIWVNGTTLKENWVASTTNAEYLTFDLMPGDNEFRISNVGYKVTFIDIDKNSVLEDINTGTVLQDLVAQDNASGPSTKYIIGLTFNTTVLNTNTSKFYIAPKYYVTTPNPGQNFKYKAMFLENNAYVDKTRYCTWANSGSDMIVLGDVRNPQQKGIHEITATYNGNTALAYLYVVDSKLDIKIKNLKLKLKSNSKDSVSLFINDRTIYNTNIGTDYKTFLVSINDGINVLKVSSSFNDKKFSGVLLICDSNESVIERYDINLNNSEFLLILNCQSSNIITTQNNYTISTEIPSTSYSSKYLRQILEPENLIKIRLGYKDILESVLVGAIDSVSINSSDKTLTIECRDNVRYLTDQNIDAERYGRRLTFPRTDTMVQFVNNPTVNFDKKVKFIKSETYLRMGPSTKYKVVAKIPVNTELFYLGEIKGWYSVLYNGKSYYVNSKDVKVIFVPKEIATGYTMIAEKDTVFKLKPADEEPTYAKILKGERLQFAGIYNSSWSKAYFKGKLGYIITNAFKTVETQSLWNQINFEIDLSTTYTRASSIIEHLAVDGVTIDHDEDNLQLSKTICNFINVDPDVYDQNGDKLDYTIKSISFPYDKTYYDAIMDIVNDMGNVWFRCNRYGDLVLSPIPVITENDEPDWYINDYVDLTDSKLKLDISYIRNRVIVIGSDGMEMYEHVGITNYITKGVHRTTAIEAKWATTSAQKREVAKHFFYQILSYYKKLSIAIKGNPLVEIGQLVKLKDSTYGTEERYVIRQWRHSFTANGFVTYLELDYIPDTDVDSIKFVTDEFPLNIKKFRYDLKLSKNTNSPINLNVGHTIEKSKIRIYDPTSGLLLTELTIVPYEVQNSSSDNNTKPAQTVTTKSYVYLKRNNVNIRTSASISSNSNIKRTERSGFKAEYLGTEGKFYKIKDPKDGKTAYIWASYCEIKKETITSVSPKQVYATQVVNVADDFVNLVKSKIGCGYVWGTEGESLTPNKLSSLKKTFGAKHYVNANKWMGMQVFDCSGLVCWALKELSLISSRYTAHNIFHSLCYPISKSQLQPGDLCFKKNNKGRITHVAIYIGNDEVVEAQSTAVGVVKSKLRTSLNVYGRLSKLSTNVKVPIKVVAPAISNSGSTVANAADRKYSVLSTFKEDSASNEAKLKAKNLGGKVLCEVQNSILYSVEIASYKGEYNVIRLNWANLAQSDRILRLYYEYITY